MSSPRRLAPADAGWPPDLADLAAPPDELHLLGSLDALAARRVAIVGTRRADPEALRFTLELAAALAEAGFAIVSGGALGVDAAAHEGALEVGGRTVVVLASGVVKPYPRRHADLFAQVVERGGLLLSEERDCAPHRGRFLKRNRVIAALGEATVVVQAPARSGALSTARHAAKLGRPLLAVPASPWDLRGAGGSHLLTGDARPCFGPEDVLAALERAAEADASEGMEVGDAAPRRAGAGASRRAAGTGRAKVEGRVASPLAAPTRPRRRTQEGRR